jgi:putative zinc finger/helix-turn-helix YgiT family protein
MIKMPIKCRQCEQAELEPAIVRLNGKVRGEEYSIEMLGLRCRSCTYQTVDGPDMPEYGRLLADKYRVAHGLLTSEEIHKRREGLGMSQQAFADFLGVGVASVKRWEMGKIQDARNNALIVEKTAESTSNVLTYLLDAPRMSSTMNFLGNVSAEVTIIGTVTGKFGGMSGSFERVEQYFSDAAKEPLYCFNCKQTGWAQELPNHQTVPPYIAAFFTRRKERRQHARSH